MLDNYSFRADCKYSYSSPQYILLDGAQSPHSLQIMCLLIFLFKAMLPLLLVLLYIIISIATRQNEGWIATGSWENGNEMESSTWNNNMQITLAYDQQQRKWCFFGKTAYLVFGMHSFFFFLTASFSCYLSRLFFFFFWDQNKIIKKQKFNLTLHVTQWQM